MNGDHPAYCWVDNGVLVVPDNEDPPQNVLLVDTWHRKPKYRYGQYVNSADGWKHYPIAAFPPEFRMHLLLLGVT